MSANTDLLTTAAGYLQPHGLRAHSNSAHALLLNAIAVVDTSDGQHYTAGRFCQLLHREVLA